jgi:hypothetical protein
MAIVVAFLAVALVGCGSASPGDCSTSACMSGVNAGQTIKVCAHPNGTVTYQFGGSTCSCTISTSGGCPCGQQVLHWCGDSSADGGGGSDGGGGADAGATTDGGGSGAGNDLAPMPSCTFTLSGGLTATGKCAVSIKADSYYKQWTFDFGSGVISGTGYDYIGPTLTIAGAAQAGTFDHSQGSSNSSIESVNGNDPFWRESYTMVSIIGQLTLTITSLGVPVTNGTVSQYPNAHGSLAATLVNLNKSVTAPDVQLKVTF